MNPPLLRIVALMVSGVHFKKALFVPNTSVYNKVGTASQSPAADAQVDVSWQMALQRVWENLTFGEKGNHASCQGIAISYSFKTVFFMELSSFRFE
ncbi:hypothetical protein ACS0TY_024009 [Phlomoides rotata]